MKTARLFSHRLAEPSDTNLEFRTSGKFCEIFSAVFWRKRSSKLIFNPNFFWRFCVVQRVFEWLEKTTLFFSLKKVVEKVFWSLDAFLRVGVNVISTKVLQNFFGNFNFTVYEFIYSVGLPMVFRRSRCYTGNYESQELLQTFFSTNCISFFSKRLQLMTERSTFPPSVPLILRYIF